MSEALHAQVVLHTENCLHQIAKQLNTPLKLPSVSFNQRGKIAGAAILQKNHIRYNPTLLADNQQVYFDEVIPHEVCHIAVYQLFGRVQPHGVEWRSMMQSVFNLPGKTTHSLDVEKVQGKMFNYQCSCATHQLTIRRHNKVQKGYSYICKSCHTPLTLV